MLSEKCIASIKRELRKLKTIYFLFENPVLIKFKSIVVQNQLAMCVYLRYGTDLKKPLKLLNIKT